MEWDVPYVVSRSLSFQILRTGRLAATSSISRPAQDMERANSRDVELDEPADLLIHEILGIDPFAESLLPFVLDARERALAVYFRAHLDEDIQLATAPFAPLTSWGRGLRLLSRSLAVAPGDEVRLRVELMSRRGRQRLDIDLA